MIMKILNYSNSRIEWLPFIPEQWKTIRLGSVFKERTEIVSDKDFAPLSVTKNGIVPQLESAAKTDNGDNRKKVCKEDFVINSRSDRKGSGGISPYDGSVSVISIVLKSNNLFDKNYTNHLFTNKYFQEEFYKKGQGIVADLWSTKYQDMKTIVLPVPLLKEQIEIASFINSQSEKINSFILKKKRFIELLKEQRQSIINHAVTKGINPKAKMKSSGVEWLGEVPEHWEVRRLGTIGRFSKGGNISRAELIYSDNGVPAILYGDIYTKYDIKADIIINRISNETAIESVELKMGDLLFTGSGETKEDIGKCIVFNSDVRAYAGGDVIIFKQEVFDSYFISYSQNSSIARHQKAISSKGEIIVHTYGSKLRDVIMPYPPIEEQKQIVQHIIIETQTIDTAIFKAEREIELIKEYKEAMIAEAVMGKLNNH